MCVQLYDATVYQLQMNLGLDLSFRLEQTSASWYIGVL